MSTQPQVPSKQVASKPEVTAKDGGKFKGHAMIEIEGYSAHPLKISGAKAAKVVYAAVAGKLATLPAFVEEYNKLVDVYGDPS
jgi:hypothetical protein